MEGQRTILNLRKLRNVFYFTINPTKKLRKNIPSFALHGNGIVDDGNCSYFWEEMKSAKISLQQVAC
jgi:hypothetical protein